MKDLTLQLTTEDLARLTEAATRFGTFATEVAASDGTPIYLAVSNNNKRAPRKPRNSQPEEPPKVQQAGAHIDGPAESKPQ